MAFRNGADLASALTENEARLFVQDTGKCNGQIDSRTPSSKQAAIRAELAWSDTATALGIVAHSNSPVIALCRMLIASGSDPSTPLEAWRDSTLCLRIRAIGEAAELRVNPKGTGFVKGRSGVPTALPVSQNGGGHG